MAVSRAEAANRRVTSTSKERNTFEARVSEGTSTYRERATSKEGPPLKEGASLAGRYEWSRNTQTRPQRVETKLTDLRLGRPRHSGLVLVGLQVPGQLIVRHRSRT
jgi:hypothetical protein